MNLMKLIEAAAQVKPPFGATCNKCGWCCMTGTCDVAKELGAGEMIPCKFLKIENDDGEYLCSLVERGDPDGMLDFYLAIGTGCDAKTQKEIIAGL